jgi:hypothetical protein
VTTSNPTPVEPKSALRYLGPDGGLPYAPGMPSFAEPTLLMILAFASVDELPSAQPLVDWALRSRTEDGSIGLNRQFPREGRWNTSLLAIALHHLGSMAERDAAIDFMLKFRSIPIPLSPENAIDTRLIGWPWVPETIGWVEPTSWALMALRLAGMTQHPRAVEGLRLLADRCMEPGGWNYGNKVVFNNSLIPFWDSTAIALLALDPGDGDLVDRSLDLLERSLPEIRSLYSSALACICLARFGRKTDALRGRIREMLSAGAGTDENLAHSALGFIALGHSRVLTP